MRVLFSFGGGGGHFEPLAPIARAVAGAGHDVAFATAAPMLPLVEERGFVGIASAAGLGSGSLERRPLTGYDHEREMRVLHDVFGGPAGRARAENMLRVHERWRPDVAVCEEADFGAAVAAERRGVPHATVLINGVGSFFAEQVVREAVEALRAEHGLGPGSRFGPVVLSPFPPSLRDPAAPWPEDAHALRLAAPGSVVAEPEWLQALGPDLVYFTLGTVFPHESGDLFTRVLAGLRELGRGVLVTVGRHFDPAELGPQPAHVRVERFVDQALVLPRCAAVVAHAGSGTLVATLAHGLPSVLLPMGADQPVNAARCARLGLARVLDPLTATPEEVRDAVSAVLTEPGHRRAAERLRDEIAALPGPESAVPLLEALRASTPPS